MSRALDTLLRGVKREGAIIRDFAMTPKGPFETIDRMVRTVRTTVRGTARAAGVPSVRGQLKGQKLGSRIRGKSPFRSLGKQLSPARVGKNIKIIKGMATKGRLPKGLLPQTRGAGGPLAKVQRAVRRRVR